MFDKKGGFFFFNFGSLKNMINWYFLNFEEKNDILGKILAKNFWFSDFHLQINFVIFIMDVW